VMRDFVRACQTPPLQQPAFNPSDSCFNPHKPVRKKSALDTDLSGYRANAFTS